MPDSYAGSADRSVFPARIPEHAWERVNTLLAARVNDVRGWTGPFRGEPDLLAGGLDLSTLEVAGCAARPAGQRFSDCSPTPAVGGGDGHLPARRDRLGDMPLRRTMPPSKRAGPSLPVLCPGRPSMSAEEVCVYELYNLGFADGLISLTKEVVVYGLDDLILLDRAVAVGVVPR